MSPQPPPPAGTTPAGRAAGPGRGLLFSKGKQIGWVPHDKLVEALLEEAERVASASGVDGVNIGVNSGPAAGQTVGHAHVHVIPQAVVERAESGAHPAGITVQQVAGERRTIPAIAARPQR